MIFFNIFIDCRPVALFVTVRKVEHVAVNAAPAHQSVLYLLGQRELLQSLGQRPLAAVCHHRQQTHQVERVSTEQQNLDRQLDMLQKYGVDFIYNEKMTGTKRNRPELEKLLERLTEGDTVVVESLSRLGRSTKDLIWLMETFNSKGVNLVSLKESIDTTTSTGKLLFTLMSALAQFERDVLAD